jgi:hypothetical protein
MTYLRIHETASPLVEFSEPSNQIFLPIPDLPNHEISISGDVRNKQTGHFLKLYIRKSSVRYYVLCYIGRIHRLLMSALSGRTLSRQELVRHVNGDSFDNSPDNLKVGTARSNAIDKILSNTNGRLLRNSQIREIRRLAQTHTRREIALLFGVSAAHVGRIITRKRWSNLP